MKLTKKLIHQFNQPDTILVISKYPYDSIGQSHHGVATYTQHQIRQIAKQTNKKFIVLVQDEYQRSLQKDGKNILILPCFNSSKFMFLQLLKALKKFDRISIIHVHSEFYTSGDPIQMALTIPFLAILRLMGKKVYYTAHNVIENFDFIARHLGKKQNDPFLKLLGKTVPFYYFALSRSTTKIIALDQEVKRKLTKYSLQSDVYLSPHWIYPQSYTATQRRKWRTELGYETQDFVIMNFGFMTRYKGSDWLVEAVKHLRINQKQKHVHLILAGGKAASQTGKKHYEVYYADLVQQVAQNSGIILTGFISEDEIQKYFAIADVVVLPYRGILGASGSWAQALAYGKPFLLSQDLAPYLNDVKIQELMEKYKLSVSDITFRRNKQTFSKIIIELMENPTKRKMLSKLARDLSLLRSANQQIKQDLQLYSPQGKLIPLQWIKFDEIKQKVKPAFLFS